METYTLDEMTILDLEDYSKIKTNIFKAAITRLKNNHTRFRPLYSKVGLARIFNLLEWKESERLEYVDDETVSADQLVHAAIHQAVADHFPDEVPWNLAGEALASAADIYLIGKCLERKAIGTLACNDFIRETLQSWCDFYEMYDCKEEDYNELLIDAGLAPFTAMFWLAQYLFDFAEPILCNNNFKDVFTELDLTVKDLHYPLIHHYNITNWILNLRNKAGDAQNPEAWTAARQFLFSFANETAFMNWLAGKPLTRKKAAKPNPA